MSPPPPLKKKNSRLEFPSLKKFPESINWYKTKRKNMRKKCSQNYLFCVPDPLHCGKRTVGTTNEDSSWSSPPFTFFLRVSVHGWERRCWRIELENLLFSISNLSSFYHVLTFCNNHLNEKFWIPHGEKVWYLNMKGYSHHRISHLER